MKNSAFGEFAKIVAQLSGHLPQSLLLALSRWPYTLQPLKNGLNHRLPLRISAQLEIRGSVVERKSGK